MFKSYVASYAGLNGGDPESPVWFCALEWGGGFANGGKVVNASEFTGDALDFDYLTKTTAENLLLARWHGEPTRPGGSAFYRSQYGIATALIENPPEAKLLTRARQAVSKYEFMGKHRLVYSLNLSPISMSCRSKAEGEWRKPALVKVPEHDELTSFAEWTGFKHYAATSDPEESFVPWCAIVRSPLFVELRRKYAPAVIYCGGWSVAFNEFCVLWTGKSREQLAFETEAISGLGCNFIWLENGEGKRPTLLMIGPFFCNRYGLNSYKKFWAVAKAIRHLTEKTLGKEGLQFKKFIPCQVV